MYYIKTWIFSYTPVTVERLIVALVYCSLAHDCCPINNEIMMQ